MRKLFFLLVVLTLSLAGCRENPVDNNTAPETKLLAGMRDGGAANPEEQLMAWGQEINLALAGAGANYRAYGVNWLAAPNAEMVGQTLYFFNVGRKQLGLHFVSGDPRRNWSPGDDIVYRTDQVQGATGLTIAQTTAAINAAMGTWEDVICSDIPITALPNVPAVDLGIAGGGVFGAADIVHSGWLPNLGPGVLGVSVPFVWIDGNGNTTDINLDGKIDIAFWEIYYSNAFPWAVDLSAGKVDVQTVALHEAGHGLDQAHFGQLFRTDANGFFHFAPRAVMNAGYTGPQRMLLGSDEAGHCSIWAQWPQN